MFKKASELFKGYLSVPVFVQLRHQRLHLGFAHVTPAELAQLARIDRPRVVLVEGLRENLIEFNVFNLGKG